MNNQNPPPLSLTLGTVFEKIPNITISPETRATAARSLQHSIKYRNYLAGKITKEQYRNYLATAYPKKGGRKRKTHRHRSHRRKTHRRN
jgi:hypothetical protein